jgi:hypothetical protein
LQYTSMTSWQSAPSTPAMNSPTNSTRNSALSVELLTTNNLINERRYRLLKYSTSAKRQGAKCQMPSSLPHHFPAHLPAVTVGMPRNSTFLTKVRSPPSLASTYNERMEQYSSTKSGTSTSYPNDSKSTRQYRYKRR